MIVLCVVAAAVGEWSIEIVKYELVATFREAGAVLYF